MHAYTGTEHCDIVVLKLYGGYSISGRVIDFVNNPIPGVTVSVGNGHSAVTDSNGIYTISNLPAGTYRLLPSKNNYHFCPTSQTWNVPPDITGQNFTGEAEGAMTDTDNDALPDLWESCGYDYNHDGLVDVDLPEMGVNPLHKDVFVEVDYMEDKVCFLGACIIGHTHKPNPDAIAEVVKAFADAPVGNVDGIHGINLHIDFGSDTPMTSGKNWGAFSRSNSLPHSEFITEADLLTLKQNPTNFDPARQKIFHYSVFAHFLGNPPPTCISGISLGIPNANFIITLGGWGYQGGQDVCSRDPGGWRAIGTRFQQAGTFMHELGHNLGLHHGGNDDIKGKPNYLSVMNYAFQTRGLIFNGEDSGIFDYSRTNLTPPLVEQQLNETVGLNGGSATENYGTRWSCPNVVITQTLNANAPIDWDCDKAIDQNTVSVNINQAWYSSANEPPSPPDETLGTFFDWESLSFGGDGQLGDRMKDVMARTTEITDELTLEMDNLISDTYEVSVFGPGGYLGLPNHTTNYTVTITNLGLNLDTYTITVTSSLGWANLATVPVTITLAPNEIYEILIPVTIPQVENTPEADILRIAAISHGNPIMWSSHYIRTTILNVLYLPLLGK